MPVTVDEVRAVAASLPRAYEVFVGGRVKFRVGQIVFLAGSILGMVGRRIGLLDHDEVGAIRAARLDWLSA